MRKLFLTLALIMSFALVMPALATTQNDTGAGPGHSHGLGGSPDQGGNMGSNGKLVGNASPQGGECGDTDNCFASAEGNFDINTFAAGGGLDFDGKLIHGGATGGISAAGGVAGGQASGYVEEGQIYGYTIKLGDTSASLDTTAGGLTRTNSYEFTPQDFDHGRGLGTQSDGSATTRGSVEVAAHGLAEASGFMFGVAGQATLDGSIIGPHDSFNSNGVSLGVAGQGSVGGFVGGAATGLYGDVAIEAGVDMWGGSYSESYRGVNYDGPRTTETMGTNVGAWTEINSYSNVDRNGLALGYVDGGYVAGGIAATKTVQTVATENGGGIASAKALGTYSGAGELGCDFSATANGYSQTSATTMKDYNGSVMNSQAGMSIQIGEQQAN